MQSPGLKLDFEKRLATFDLRVQLEAGAEILVLFGPSGAGKTQTLNAIAGLTAPDSGEIVLGGEPFFRSGPDGNAFNLPPRKRRVGYVFQQYALFPHLTALENVAYALWRRPTARAEAEALLERVHLSGLSGRYPHELSGGQQQRVAIARALAMRPRVLLLDEPFSALDGPTRRRLHQDLVTLQREEALTVVYVTHNLADAFAVGHRLAIMREGRIEQVGVPEDVRRNPANPLVLAALGLE